MAVLTIEIPDQEMSWLNALAKKQGMTKAELVRFALRSLFEENFIDERPILVSEDAFNTVMDMIDEPLTQEEIEGRRRLAAARMWALPK